jgi:hypothetical protein
MNKLRNNPLMLAALLILTVSSCIDDTFDTPPVVEIPVGSVLTIQGLRDLCPPGNSYKFTGDASVYAIVTMDEKSGNIYKNAFLQDPTGAVNLRFLSSSALYEGDSIRLYLKGAVLGRYRGMFQVDSLHADSSVIKQATNRHITPQIATIPEIKSLLSDYYQSRLVKIENVQFIPSDTAKVWADAVGLNYINRTLQDTLGNQIIIRTSGYAKFATQLTPTGYGSLVAIVTEYDGTAQLVIRKVSDVNLNEPRWSDSSIQPSGNGSFDTPFNVAAAVSNNTGFNKWVEGYIVGVIETNVDPFVANFVSPFATNSNLLIADESSETNLSKCLTVQLPAGTIRDILNLVTHPENQGKQVKLFGNLEAYFGQPGIKGLTGFWFEGNGIIPVVGFWEENFNTNLGVFIAHNIVGAQVWVWGNFDGGCAVMNGFSSGAQNNEDWLVSPAINLADKVNVNMAIREAVNYSTDLTNMKVLISNNYDGSSLPTVSGDWTELAGFTRPVGNSWTFVDSGNIDISQYDGETIYIAFKYNSTTSVAATWEVSKVQLYEIAK